MRSKYIKVVTFLSLMLLVRTHQSVAQIQHRIGTTTANFLEIGIGGAGSAMGEAYVSVANDLTALYWNPAGLAYLERNEFMVVHQPWIVDMSSAFVAAGVVLPRIGTLALGVNYMGYGEMDVTNLDFPEGNGEKFSPSDFAFSLAYSRRLAQWFAFGAAAKFVKSQIWHSNASALAVDLGVIVNTEFFSPSTDYGDGMKIAMSISNYGSRMRYDGMDLMNPIDINLSTQGNFAESPGRFYLNSWELPLIFRVGLSVMPLKTSSHKLTVAVDALHPNNNAESINVGGEYGFTLAGFGEFYLRSGYKALFMPNSEYGPTFGGGILMWVTRTSAIKLNYAFKSMGILGNTHCYGLGLTF